MRSRRARVDAAIFLGAALTAGGLLPSAPWEVGLAGACVVARVLSARAAGRWLVSAALLVLALGALRARAVVVRHEADRRAAAEVLPAPTRCSARGRVRSSPVEVRGGLRWDADLAAVSCADARGSWDGVATLYGGPDDLARGDEVELVAMLAPPQRFWNLATGDPRPGEARRGVLRSGGVLDVRRTRRASDVAAWVDRVRARVRRQIEASFGGGLAPMARALVLGESDLAADDDQAFRGSGLSHLLAVSGMHLVLVSALALRGLEALLVRTQGVAARVDVKRLAAAAGIPAVWLYADFAGGGGSTVRAAWMMTASLAARVLGRKPDAGRAFGLSVCVMALADPLVAFDLSFALSAGATAGLLAFARPLAGWLEERTPRIGARLVGPVSTTLAASVPCAPLLARFAPTQPLGGVVANLLAVPLGESAALPLCLLHAALGAWPAAQRGCAIAASGALLLVRALARWFSAPSLTVQVPQPTSWQLAVLAVVLAHALLRVTAARGEIVRPGGRGARAFFLLGGIALAGLEVAARRSGAPRGLLRVSFLDVGQGDAALVDLPDGRALVIDGGGLVGSPVDVGARVLAPELRARRRDEVAVVVLSHPHPDHFGGLPSGLEAVRVGALWDTGQGEREGTAGGYADLLSRMRSRGVPVVRPASLCGVHVFGLARIEVLAPCPDFSSDRGPNDNSFVLRITYGRRAVLFVGDAEREEEGLLLASAADRLRADVLKVGHHGSRTSSSPDFLAAVEPRAALLSVGCRNRYGHPSPATLSALVSRGVHVWRTDEDGAVVFSTDGVSMEVSSAARR